MKRRRTKSVERYHDRVAKKYDASYEGSRYWDFYRDITWNHIKRYLPCSTGSFALDAGCGTGYWGIRLAKCGMQVTFLDISSGMVEETKRKVRQQGLEGRCSFIQGDIQSLTNIESSSCSLIVAQGDPLSCCERPERAVAAFHRVLSSNGVAIVSVDGLYGGSFYFLERNDIPGLEQYLTTGRSCWQTTDPAERFPTRSFSADHLRRLFEREGFLIETLIGKPVLPLRRYRRLLDDDRAYRSLISLEKKLCTKHELLGGAAHLEIAVRKQS